LGGGWFLSKRFMVRHSIPCSDLLRLAVEDFAYVTSVRRDGTPIPFGAQDPSAKRRRVPFCIASHPPPDPSPVSVV